MSQILIIGHSVLDRIFYKTSFQERPGGIFHTVNTFVNLAEKEDVFYLLTQISDKTYKHFTETYKKINVKFSEFTNEIPTVTLNLYDNKERDEKYSRVTQKINLPGSIDLPKFDVILVNMVSGFDISYQDLKTLKEKSNCEIYFDVHTLSRSFDKNGNRVFRIIPEIEK